MIAQAVLVQFNGGLGIVQFATGDRDVFQYMSSSKVIKEKRLEVREVSEAGDVNQLLVINSSEHHVFLMGGDILTGAKQNRVVNTSVLLAPMSKTVIPVSCVEQGRWSRTSETFNSAGFTAPTSLRASASEQVRASLSRNEGHQADQGAIWDSVREYQTAFHVSSRTGSLTDVFADQEEQMRAAAASFTRATGANGLAVFFGRQLVSLDLFHRSGVYEEYFPGLVRGALLESRRSPARKTPAGEAEVKFRTLDFLDASEEASAQEFPGVAVGVERRFELSGLLACDLRVEGRTVHLSALRTGTRKTRASRVA